MKVNTSFFLTLDARRLLLRSRTYYILPPASCQHDIAQNNKMRPALIIIRCLLYNSAKRGSVSSAMKVITYYFVLRQ